MTTIEKLKLLQSVKYKAYGFNMIGLFYSYNTGVPSTAYKWFFYFRNAEDENLKALSEQRFEDVEDCLNNAIEKLTESGYLKQ